MLKAYTCYTVLPLTVVVLLWERWGYVSMHRRTLLTTSRPWGISNLRQRWLHFYSFLHTIIIYGQWRNKLQVYNLQTKNRPGMVWEVQFHTSASLILNDNTPTSVKFDITTALTIMITVLGQAIYHITCCVTSQRIAAIICRQSWHSVF